MKKTIIIFLLLYIKIGFSQDKTNTINSIEIHSIDSNFYFPVWEVKNENLYSMFDRIIEKNNKCLKKKKWDFVGNDYFFKISIFSYPNISDTCSTYKIKIIAYAGTSLIETFLMSYGNFSYDKGPYSGVIIYKNNIFMIWNNPKVNNNVSFISKTNNFHKVLIQNKSYINFDSDKSVTVYKFEYEYLYKNGNFRLIKKGCCP